MGQGVVVCNLQCPGLNRLSRTKWDVVSQMDIMLPGQRTLVPPSAVVQERQRLGSQAVREVFAHVVVFLCTAINADFIVVGEGAS